MNDNGKHFAWRIVQVLASFLLAVVAITTPMMVSAVSNIHEATHALSERVTAIEANRFTVLDGHGLQRQIDSKACLDHLTDINNKLATIQDAVTRLEVLAEQHQ